MKVKATFRIPSQLADWAGQALQAHFPDGLLSQPSKGSYAAMTGWPGARVDHEALRQDLGRLGATHLRFHAFRPRDWARDYRSRFPIQRLGRFTILPSWKRRAKILRGSLPIVLLPGQAFGTGLHQSTRLMLKALCSGGAANAFDSTRLRPADNVLDIGAGSGILGFACLRLGSRKVTAVEIEEAACAEMRGNRALNGFAPARLRVLCGAYPAKGGALKAELVLANLVTPLLLKLMPRLKRAVKPGGQLLMSGIHTRAEARQVAAAAKAAGLGIESKASSGEWWCLRASR